MLTDAANANALLQRWLSRLPEPPTLSEIAHFLDAEYRAYQLPLDYFDSDNFAGHPEVRSDLVDSLFTITHRQVLERLAAEGADETTATCPDADDSYWRGLLDSSLDDLPRQILDAQHCLGQRVSILLEKEEELVTGFKVFGVLGAPVARCLTAHIGFPIRRSGDPDERTFMVPGDLEDDHFRSYLELAAEYDLI